jgi:restriction endonuclease S subunit
MRIGELFDVKYGINFELDACEIDENGINFVSRTSENNGVVARVKRIVGKEPQSAGILTCAGSGSVLSTFVQNEPFYSGRDLYILIPKNDMRLEEKLFYCHCIKMNAYRYGYGRQANKTLKDIDLPEIPEWLKRYKIDRSIIETNIKKQSTPLNIKEWKEFKLRDLFNFQRGKGITKQEIDGNLGDIPCIQGGGQNNGVLGYMGGAFVSDKNHVYVTAPLLSIARVGTSGSINVQSRNSYIGDKAIALKLKESESLFIYLFLATILNRESYRYVYGRGVVIENYIDSYIRLPALCGSPDWQYMEDYIKALPYSDLI